MKLNLWTWKYKTNKKVWNKIRVFIIDLDISAKINLQFIKWIPRPVSSIFQIQKQSWKPFYENFWKTNETFWYLGTYLPRLSSEKIRFITKIKADKDSDWYEFTIFVSFLIKFWFFGLLKPVFSSPTLWSLPKIKLELNCQSDGFEAKVGFILEETRMEYFLAKSMSSKSLSKKFALSSHSSKNTTNIGEQNDIQMHLWRRIYWNWKHLWWHKRVRRLYKGVAQKTDALSLANVYFKFFSQEIIISVTRMPIASILPDHIHAFVKARVPRFTPAQGPSMVGPWWFADPNSRWILRWWYHLFQYFWTNPLPINLWSTCFLLS